MGAEMRDSMRKQFPALKLTDIARKMGEAWKALNDDAKEEQHFSAPLSIVVV